MIVRFVVISTRQSGSKVALSRAKGVGMAISNAESAIYASGAWLEGVGRLTLLYTRVLTHLPTHSPRSR